MKRLRNTLTFLALALCMLLLEPKKTLCAAVNAAEYKSSSIQSSLRNVSIEADTISGTMNIWGYATSLTVYQGNLLNALPTPSGTIAAQKNVSAGDWALATDVPFSIAVSDGGTSYTGYTVFVKANDLAWAAAYIPYSGSEVNPLPMVKLLCDTSATLPGTPLHFSAEISGGHAPYRCTFKVVDVATGKTAVLRNLASSASYIWTPVTSGRKNIYVEVLDSEECTASDYFSVYVRTDETDIPDEPLPLISASFLQGWLCRDWNQERWNQEFAAMKSLGMKSLILQSSYDWATSAASDSSFGQDWSHYSTTSRYSLYPTEISELKGANNSADQLERALKAAKENDMTVYIGLISDDRWWKFGWGIPTAASSNADLHTDSYFAQWCAYNGELSASMITEIWKRYASDYADQIGGWYYNNEIWNVDVGCAGTDNGIYAQILADNLNLYLDAINESCPEKPLMLSPYFNRTLSTGAQYRDFWKAIIANTAFRPGDILAPQDCIGEHPDQINTAEEWIGGLANAAATQPGLRFWVNNETFTASYGSAPVDRVIQQIEASDPYVQTHILFSWNHYYNPLYNNAFQSYHDQLATYLYSKAEVASIGIDVPVVKQAQTQWCWAACAEMAGKNVYPSTDRTQYSAVQYVKGNDSNPYPNVTGTAKDGAIGSQYISYDKKTFSYIIEPWSYNQIVASLKNGYAVQAGAGTYSGSTRVSGHRVVINNAQFIPEFPGAAEYIDYQDPWDGKTHHCTFASFCDGSYNGRIYDQTVFVK